MNNITDLLDLEDSEIIIKDIQIHGQTKTLFLKRHLLRISAPFADTECIHAVLKAGKLNILFFRIITLLS